MKKNLTISLVIFVVTFVLPFRFAVLDVDSDSHALSTFGVFFTGVGFIAGFYFLLKDDISKNHEDSSHH